MICPSDAPESRLTLGQLLETGSAYLLRHGVPPEEVQTQSEILLSEGLSLPRGSLLLRLGDCPSPEQVQTLRHLFLRVARGEPIQYVLGHWQFHNIELKTDSRALIPRPETEQLVERVLHDPIWKRATRIADIGTGTGAIALALAAAARASGDEAKHFSAVDLSPDALSLARENAHALDLEGRVDCILGDGAKALGERSCDIVVSNPPYIASADVDALPSLILDHEPRLALDGGADGLSLLRQLVLDATLVLKPHGKLFLEIGDEQGFALRRLLECAGYTQITISKDYAGRDRYAEGALP